MIQTMRKRALLATVVLLAACVHDVPRPVAVAPALEPAAPPTPPPLAAPPQYLVADPVRPSALTVLPIDADRSGVLLEGQRYSLLPEGARAAHDVAGSPLQGGWRVPSRLGGGFLFHARGTLYLSETFDGLLRPLIALPADVASVSFGPSSAFVVADTRERWMIDLTSGRRLPVAPPGLLDIAALDDGRAVALTEGGGLLVSSDAGAHWAFASARLRAPGKRVFVLPGDVADAGLWIETAAGGAARVMPAGRLSEYDSVPASPTPPALRPKPVGWREDEPPLRRAMRAGVPYGDGAALVVASGDLVRVDLNTGDTTTIVAGRLPPDASCAGTRTPDDIVFTCTRPGGIAFVVAHALDAAPVIEQTFQEAGRFVVSDDGGIAFLGACDRPLSHDRHVACVRSPGGSWQLVDADLGAEGGASGQIVRWIPRGDGDAIAVVSTIGGVANAWGLIDARTGQLHAWPTDALTATLQAALVASPESGRSRGADATRIVDRGWTTTPQGTLRGWASLPGGIGAIDVGLDGSVQASAFTFDHVAPAGAFALARQRDGRVWQTVDRGSTWSEVAAPSTGNSKGALDPRACSLVGCDLAQWYRVGWAATPPSPLVPPAVAPAAPRMDRVPLPALTCHATGELRRAAAPRSDRSPEDLGLGAARVGVSDGAGRLEFLRLVFGPRIVGSVHDADSGDASALRALVHGPATEPGDGRFIVQGPSRDAMALVRQVSFVPAFDPRGALRRVALAMPDIVAGSHAAGVGVADALRDDPVPSGVVPVTPADPAAAGGLLVQLANGGAAVLPGGPPSARRSVRTRVAFEPSRGDEWRIVSAVELDGDAVAWLEEDPSGQARIMRVGESGVPAPVGALDASPSANVYPANVDALAVGPRGELSVLRTPSGREPASAFDPAMVVAAGAGVLPLAPWSTLVPADDPACKADVGGFRATVQVIGPWVRLAGDLRGADDSPMLARVRWSPTRVCLEGLEVRAEDLTLASSSTSSPFGSPWDQPVETWVVLRFGAGARPGAAAGKVAVFAGAELHQVLECSLGSP
jgi:hypothetical protein